MSDRARGKRYGRRPTESPEVRAATAARLASLRKAAGLSQIEVSDRLGHPKSWIGKLETGRRSLLFSEAVAITDLYGIGLRELASDINSEPDAD
jgi:transcriptional regulator with XRE-family HTH domain